MKIAISKLVMPVVIWACCFAGMKSFCQVKVNDQETALRKYPVSYHGEKVIDRLGAPTDFVAKNTEVLFKNVPLSVNLKIIVDPGKKDKGNPQTE